MQIIYKKPAIKFLKSTSKANANRMLLAIEGLTKTPPEGDIRPLQGRIGEFRLRVGKYRITYEYNSDNLIIIDIGSRGDIYK